MIASDKAKKIDGKTVAMFDWQTQVGGLNQQLIDLTRQASLFMLGSVTG